jgi:hypothetical protein
VRKRQLQHTDKIPFATRVGNGVLAPYHQHIVSRVRFEGGGRW